MGRIGVSEHQVFQAADQLAAEGIQPSVDTVRAELGNTGSRTTINKYLKLWRERKAHRDAAGANLSGHLRQVISDQAELLLSVLEAESSAKLLEKSQEFEANTQSLVEKNQQLERARLDSKAIIESLQKAKEQQSRDLLQRQSELVDVQEENQTLRESLAKEIGRREILERALNDRGKQIAALQKEIKLNQSRNEILSEAIAAKSSELQQVQQKDRDQRALIKEKAEEIKRLGRELTNLRTHSEKELSRLAQILAKLVPGSKQKQRAQKAR
ncbi:MAG: DNA-binding protein [Spongiibacteraceae bacterium]